MAQPVIFTDLDGTLLDSKNYAFTEALPALRLVQEKQIPLVFCTSKTRAEISYWRKRLKNTHPFIAENGGGVFTPRSYFPRSDIDAVWEKTKRIPGYLVLILGTPYPILRRTIEELRNQGFEVKGFGDMNTVEVAELTGLDLAGAEMAKKREFDEPFVFSGNEDKVQPLLDLIRKRGLRYGQGRYYHLTGDNDKGRAVDLLKELYRRRFGKVVTICVGDSPVDFSMLEKADYPVLVRNYRGEHDQRIMLPNLIREEGVGPHGWNRAMLRLIQEIERNPTARGDLPSLPN